MAFSGDFIRRHAPSLIVGCYGERLGLMMITVVALVCHQITGITAPVCHEEIVTKQDMPMQACLFSQPAIAEWKMNSNYRGDQWVVAKVRCIPGEYEPRDAI